MVRGILLLQHVAVLRHTLATIRGIGWVIAIRTKVVTSKVVSSMPMQQNQIIFGGSKVV